MNDKPVAHVSEDGRVHFLREHLEGSAFTDNVMVSMSNHADEFGCGEWGRLAGLWQRRSVND